MPVISAFTFFSQGRYGVLRCNSIAVLQTTSRIRASFIGGIPFTADSPGVAVSPWCSISPYPPALCFLSCLHDPAGYSSCDVLCRW